MNISQKTQGGAVLVVALIMLLLLTIIGIGSMRGTSFQENMASNFREGNISFQSAEAALRKGEEVLSQKFIDNSFHTLEVADETGTHADYTGLAASPEYTLILLAKLRTSTEAGVPIDDEGALVRVEGEGYGVSIRSDDSPASITRLRSTFLIEQ